MTPIPTMGRKAIKPIITPQKKGDFKPRLVGQRVQMHTLLVFLSIIGGLKLFGILGIIYGPLIVTAFLTLTDIYKTSYQKLVESD